MADARWLWSSPSLGARALRAALIPAAGLFRAATVARNALYSGGILQTHPLAVPAISVGNLTVGGTGKTPVAQWIAARLAERGARPAILLRGYGGDETIVHRALNPAAIVIANPDRIAGAADAKRLGADVAVLDDGFQHRRAARSADIVLINADAIGDSSLPLPAGPWRESLGDARRADLVLITRKAVSNEAAMRLATQMEGVVGPIPVAVAHLRADALVDWHSGEQSALGKFNGRRALVVSGIGNPDAFEQQIASFDIGVSPARYADHHEYTSAEMQGLLSRIPPDGIVICTLKDAVKLGPLWPREGPPLWYLSQRVSLVRGADSMAAMLDRVLALRQAPVDTTNP